MDFLALWQAIVAMDINQIITSVIALLQQIPSFGPVLVKVASITAFISLFITSIIGVWHSLIQVVQALAKVPYLEKLQTVADKLKMWDEEEDKFTAKWVFPILDRLSLIKVPTKSLPAPQDPKDTQASV